MVSFELLLHVVFLGVTSHIFSLARVCEFHRAVYKVNVRYSRITNGISEREKHRPREINET